MVFTFDLEVGEFIVVKKTAQIISDHVLDSSLMKAGYTERRRSRGGMSRKTCRSSSCEGIDCRTGDMGSL